MLAEASTIQQAKELKDLALTAADWARRKGLGNEAVQYARSYAVRAERKMGEMLAVTERARGTRVAGGTTGGPVVLPPVEDTPTLAELGVTKRESSEAQFLASLPDEKFEEVATGQKTMADALRERQQPHRLISQSNSNEWYTPVKYIEAAKRVMGGIDCDPASNEVAQKWIQAEKYHTPETDGLVNAWAGRVWLNPPWGRLTSDFIARLVEEMDEGRVVEAIVLVNAHSTDAKWFTPLWDGLLCFTNHRIDYHSETPQDAGSTHGSVFVYFGPNEAQFIEQFSQWGAIVKRVDQ